MAKIKNTFHLQTMDKETDSAFVEAGRYRHSENLRFGTNGGNDGVGTNIKGTVVVSDLTDGNQDFKCVGAEYNGSNNTIYYFLATTNGAISKIVEYRIDEDQDQAILHDTNSILNLKKDGYITGINEIDGLLFWSEWGNNPRRANVERAKQYGTNGFSEEDIMVIVKPPLYKPKITLQLSDETDKNNIQEKFISFAYRWRYLDGEYSVLSPFTSPAFYPKDFEYNYAQQHTKSMINKFNQVLIEFDTGNERVTEIQLVFKEHKSNSEWVIDDFVKSEMGYGDNQTQSFLFDNSKVYRALSDNVIRNYFDNVPLTNLAQSIIDGRLLYAHYKEGFDIKDINDEEIKIDFKLNHLYEENKILNPQAVTRSVSHFVYHIPDPINGYLFLGRNLTPPIDDVNWLNYGFVQGQEIVLSGGNGGTYTFVSATETGLRLKKKFQPNPHNDGEYNTQLTWTINQYIPSLLAKETVKSIRDYEIGIVYLEEFARSSTVLVSKTNTLNIPIQYDAFINKIQVELVNNPPKFAKYFRFFIKQNVFDYDHILPSLFYEDGVYRWVKLEGADKDKIKEGDYLIVKSDTQGLLKSLKKTKVLEIKEQPKNFLQPTDANDSIKERQGLYFKIQPEGYRINSDDYDFYKFESYHNSRNMYHNNVQGTVPYISEATFYGGGLNDLTSLGTTTLDDNTDKHFIVEIDGTGIPNTFKWSSDEGATWNNQNTSIIPNNEYTLSDGVKIKFDSSSGHEIQNRWSIYASGKIVTDNARAYAFWRTAGEIDETSTLTVREREVINEGAEITFIYDEYNRGSVYVELSLTASQQYPNIMEWFYGDNISEKILQVEPNFGIESVYFARGYVFKYPSGNANMFVHHPEGFMTMIKKTRNSQSSTKWVKVKSTLTLFQASNSNVRIIFETEGKKTVPETYHEIGKTYPIEDNLHKADLELFPNDQHQTFSEPLKVTLDWFNAFSYGNGIESYKIKDDFNANSLTQGIRTLSVSKEKYKQITRIADITWSDVYDDESNFNGLNSFNISMLNFISLDKEEGSIQLLHNANGNLLVLQEDAIGIMPYNKNVIYDTDGGRVVGISTNVLDRKSYSPYAEGMFGTRHPESFVSRGGRKYVIDQARGKLLRLSVDGITPVSDKMFDHYFSRLMSANRNTKMVAGYDPKHGEYLFNIKNTQDIQKLQEEASQSLTYSYKEKANGFPLVYTFEPDFILEADNEVYAWKKGVMYRLNASAERNKFFGIQYSSVLKFFVNAEFSVEKIWKAMGIEGSHPWAVKLATKLTSRNIEKEDFVQLEDYWYSDIMGNTNNNKKAQSSFGIGTFAINNGIIETNIKYASMSIGDTITSASLLFSPNKIIDITETQIILEFQITTVPSFLIYNKSASIDGSDIKGDVLEVEITSDETEKVELRAVNFEVIKSNIS